MNRYVLDRLGQVWKLRISRGLKVLHFIIKIEI